MTSLGHQFEKLSDEHALETLALVLLAGIVIGGTLFLGAKKVGEWMSAARR